jgi:hypothetical protein
MRTKYSREDNSNGFVPSSTISHSLDFIFNTMSMANVRSISYLVFSRSPARTTSVTLFTAFPVASVGKHSHTNTYILVVG